MTSINLEEKIKALAELGDDWDSCGAKPIQPSVITNAIRMCQLLTPEGHISPCPDGCLEYEHDDGEFTLIVSIDEAGFIDGHLMPNVQLDNHTIALRSRRELDIEKAARIKALKDALRAIDGLIYNDQKHASNCYDAIELLVAEEEAK